VCTITRSTASGQEKKLQSKAHHAATHRTCRCFCTATDTEPVTESSPDVFAADPGIENPIEILRDSLRHPSVANGSPHCDKLSGLHAINSYPAAVEDCKAAAIGAFDERLPAHTQQRGPHKVVILFNPRNGSSRKGAQGFCHSGNEKVSSVAAVPSRCIGIRRETDGNDLRGNAAAAVIAAIWRVPRHNPRTDDEPEHECQASCGNASNHDSIQPVPQSEAVTNEWRIIGAAASPPIWCVPSRCELSIQTGNALEQPLTDD
jgi:hypothetical protein